MTLYEFLNMKNDFKKMNSNKLNIVTLVKAFNIIESMGEQVSEVIIHPSQFITLQKKAQEDIFEGKNIYHKIINNQELFGAKIIINNEINQQIIQLNNVDKTEEKSVQLFIEN